MSEKHQIDLAKYRIEKAKERLLSAEALLKAGSFADSIGRSYYAIFTAARSLLALKGLDSKRHSGVVALFLFFPSFSRAIEDYNKAIQLNPNDAYAYTNRGVA